MAVARSTLRLFFSFDDSSYGASARMLRYHNAIAFRAARYLFTAHPRANVQAGLALRNMVRGIKVLSTSRSSSFIIACVMAVLRGKDRFAFRFDGGPGNARAVARLTRLFAFCGTTFLVTLRARSALRQHGAFTRAFSARFLRFANCCCVRLIIWASLFIFSTL